MASLNLSTNGPSISKSYQSVVNAAPPSGPAASSSTYGQWALFSVTTPLVNAFQQDSGSKEAVLKVQSQGGTL
jgi:drebrin-like protein